MTEIDIARCHQGDATTMIPSGNGECDALTA